MTILSRIVGRDFELTVCGSPSKEWLGWLLIAEVPLTAGQMAWRELHRGAATAPTALPRPARRTPAPFDLVDTDEL